MAVIPSHTGFAATPNLASSFLGGAKISADIAQDSSRLQMEAQRLQLQRHALAQEAQQAQMQMQAKEAQAERQALRDQQEMEMEKAYKEAQIGLRQRELQGEEKVLQFKTKQASQQMMVQQTAQRRIASGDDPARVWAELGPQAGVGLPAGIFRPPQQVPLPNPRKVSVDGQDFFEMQKGRFSYPPRASVPAGINPSTILNVLSRQQAMLQKRLDDPEIVDDLKKTPEGQKELAEIRTRLSSTTKRLEAYIPETVSKSSSGKKPATSMVQRANELAREHPDWTKEQVKRAVMQEFK